MTADAEDLADPGEKLKAVLAFRDRLYSEALVKKFQNVDQFGALLYRDLSLLVLAADEARRQRSEKRRGAEVKRVAAAATRRGL